MNNVEKINTQYRLIHAAAVKVPGQRDVNPWNIPTEGNNLSKEILEVLAMPVSRAHDAVRKGHEIESEFYDEWCSTADADQDADHAWIQNVHREACWSAPIRYDDSGMPISSGFDSEKYAAKCKRIHNAYRKQYDGQCYDSGHLKRSHLLAAMEGYRSERSDVWIEDNQPNDYLDGLGFGA